MKLVIRRAGIPVLLGICLLASGCAAPVLFLGAGAGAGAGTVAYVRGEWIQSYPEPFDKVWSASQSAVGDLRIDVIETEKTSEAGYIRGRRADGKSVAMKIVPVTGKQSEVRIRVGWFGDRFVSETIGSEIALRLRTTSG